jgi:deoxyribodipyrimidine photolyase-related protein
MTTLVPILGDQLSATLSSLDSADPADTVILMMEVAEETTYVRHHRRKIAFILSAMRHHAEALRSAGWTVDYVTLDDPDNSGSFTGEVARAIARHAAEAIVITEAGEHRVNAMIDAWETLFGLPVQICPDTRFIATRAEFEAWADDRKMFRMEHFYREMRRKTGLLMNGSSPEGGEWNYDKENRKPAQRDLLMPNLPQFAPDTITRDVLALVAARFDDHIGKLESFGLAVTREQAIATQAHFLANALPSFGDFQDAMLTGEPYLYHAHLSFYLNIGLIDPVELCRAVEAEYRAGRAPLNATEGFIRQIIGWREYVRGIYFWAGPEYGTRNFLNAERRLPAFYWTGETDMHCIRQSIGQTIDLAYAHHIQRLMVTGNYALLIGADPDAVDRWYLEVYADAYEWVEQPNTRGMVLFADGGLMASKPYAASGAYIDRMSDYCSTCRYDVKQRTGPEACPFNALYWDFLVRNRDNLGRNQRLAMPYRNWDKMNPEAQTALRAQAATHLRTLDEAPDGY